VISPDNLVVQGFWTGPFTTMERLCVKSFMSHGHRFELYAYEPIEGVSDGVVLKDAREIVPESEVATFRCAAQFSDHFRVALLLKKGGWYSDMDNVLLRPLDFLQPIVLYRDYDESTISLALSKAPAGAPFLQHCYDYVRSLSIEERARLSWQEIGTELVLGAIEYFKLTGHAQSGKVFDPIHWSRVSGLIHPFPDPPFDLSQAYSIHLFHAAWNQGPKDSTGRGFDLGHSVALGMDTDATYHPDCLYEQLKRKYL
jgi:hypothetical protein